MIEIFKENLSYDVMDPRDPRIVREDFISVDQLIDMHCSVSYRQTVDLLISFMKYQISLDNNRYVEYIRNLAEQHDYQISEEGK